MTKEIKQEIKQEIKTEIKQEIKQEIKTGNQTEIEKEIEKEIKTESKTAEKKDDTISECVTNALQVYFADLDGHDPHDLYDLILSQMEKPLFVAVLQHTQNNITRAAAMLGMNRATLGKRLKKYDL